MASYPTTILSHSPALYLKENETTGTTLVDSSGNSHNATTSGSWAVDATAPAGGGINWNGGFASVADHADLKPTLLSLEIWVKTDGTGDRGLMIKSSNGSLNDGYGWYVLSGGLRLRFYINNYNGPGQFVEIGPSVGGWNDGVWTHLVGTYDGVNIKGYINGVLDDTQPYTTAISHSSSALLVASYPSSSAFPGSTETAVLYPSVLTAAEILALYNAATGVVTDLVAETGTITMNGVAATLPVVAGTGVITVHGVQSSLARVADTGVITVTGVDAQFTPHAGTGVITITGVGISLDIPLQYTGRLAVSNDGNRTYLTDPTAPSPTPVTPIRVNSDWINGGQSMVARDPSLDPFNLTGCTAVWAVSLGAVNLYELPVTINSAVGGVVTVDAASDPIPPGTYRGRLVVTDAGGDVHSFPAGGIEMRV